MKNKAKTQTFFTPEVPFPEVKIGKVFDQKRQEIPYYRRVYNVNSNETFKVFSDDYKLVTHQEAIEKMEQALAHSEAFQKWTVKTDLIKDGARMLREYKFPDLKFDVGRVNGKPDLVNPTMRLYNTYDGSSGIDYKGGAFRLICSNGLVIGVTVTKMHRKHLNNFSVDEATDFVMDAMEMYNLQTQVWKGWQEQVMKMSSVQEAMTMLEMTKRQIEEVFELPETGTNRKLNDYDVENPNLEINKWIFYSILTQYITHKVENVRRQRIFLERMTKFR